jgi:alpha-amylase/alpha-mannosidase (GH57 family)
LARLTTSDHFYYMCTKYWADGDVHKYFSPYESPYDSYINFMNVLDNCLHGKITLRIPISKFINFAAFFA